MPCDTTKPYAFISYSHDYHDAQIVMNVFKQLYMKGFNLWIDIANMPYDENAWYESAIEALRNKNCVLAFFFRSESSMLSDAVASELGTIQKINHIHRIIAVDIWKAPQMTAENFYTYILNNGSSLEVRTCYRVCNYVSVSNKAIRLSEDAGNDIIEVVNEMGALIAEHTRLVSAPSASPINNAPNTTSVPATPTVAEVNTVIEQTDPSANDETAGKKHKSLGSGKSSTGDVTYSIYGEQFTENQSDMMFRVFYRVLSKHPDMIKQLYGKTAMDCLSPINYTLCEGQSRPPYFRRCEFFEIGEGVCVGTAYRIVDKMKKIARLLDYCGESPSVFQSDDVVLPTIKKPQAVVVPEPQAPTFSSTAESYTLYGKAYSGNQSDMMIQTLKLLMEKHFDCRYELADKLTCIKLASRDELQNVNYFRTGEIFWFILSRSFLSVK